MPGVRIGQDGFGFAMGAGGHLKVPQIGRVIIQDDVEIGANTAIDRGALKDTVIGEGTKIDNLVQIGHNVVDRPALRHRRPGRHRRLGELGDFVVMGGQSGIVGHIKIGAGAQIAGRLAPQGRRRRRAPAWAARRPFRYASGPRAGGLQLLSADKGRALRRRLARRWYTSSGVRR